MDAEADLSLRWAHSHFVGFVISCHIQFPMITLKLELKFWVIFISGAGKLTIMVKILQKECDRQSRKIVEQFRNKRDFDQRVNQVKQNLMFHKQPVTERCVH